MKRILTFIICICLVLSLCSCTEKGKSKGLDRPNIISFYDNVYDIGEFYMDFQDRICFGDLNSFVSLPICSKPNCLHDSPDCGAVGLPMTAVIIYYEDSLYRAWVSGYRPKLDSIEVYPKTIYQTVTNDIYHPVVVKPKKKRWGLGLQAGYGYPGGFYVGAGVSYDLRQW